MDNYENLKKAAKLFGAKIESKEGDSPDMVVEDALEACEDGLARIRKAHFSQSSKFAKNERAPSLVLKKIRETDLSRPEKGYLASIAWWRMIETSKDQNGLDGLRLIFRNTTFATEKERETAHRSLRKWAGEIGVFARLAAADTISFIVPDAPEEARQIKLFRQVIDGIGKKEIEGAKDAVKAAESMVSSLKKWQKSLEKEAKSAKKASKADEPEENEGEEETEEEDEA